MLIFYFLLTEITCTKASLHLTPLVNVQNDKETYNFQENVTISCNSGYSDKTVISRCTNVNTWSEYSPTCTGKIFSLVLRNKPVRVVVGLYM